MKDIVLVVDMLLWLTDIAEGAGVSDLFRLHENDIARVRGLTEAKIAPYFDSATRKARQQRGLYGALSVDCQRIPAKKLGVAGPHVRLICRCENPGSEANESDRLSVQYNT